MNRNHPIKKLVKKARSAAVLAKELEFVTKERDKLKRDFDSFKAIHDTLVDDARKGIGLNGTSPTREAEYLQKRIKDLEVMLQDANARAQANLLRLLKAEPPSTEDTQLRNLEKAHAELQKFYTQSQDELHACRERELMRPWWKKLLGLR